MGLLGCLVLAVAAGVWDGPPYLQGELGPEARRRRVELYGPELTLAARVELADCCTCVAVGDRLYAGGERRLNVFDLADPTQPRWLGRSAPFAHVRHLLVRAGYAFVASRGDGLYLVDLADEREPRIAAHYDTVEMATGLARSGDVLFVCCRNFGVELVDVSDPLRPRHLSTVRTGEAQLLDVRDGFAYVGVWGSRELVTVDARDPWRPVVTSRHDLDGYGDGVAVGGEWVYVATGHHARGLGRNDAAEPEYGRGHGLEVFRLADPARPAWVTRLKTMPSYQLGPDCWVPKVAGDHLFLADGLGGLYVIDVKDPASPRFVGQALLPYVPARERYDYAHDLAVLRGHVVVAGAFGGLAIHPVPGAAVPEQSHAGVPIAIGPEPAPELPRGWRAWRCGGQARNVDVAGDLAVVAAGSAGAQLVRVWPTFETVATLTTEGWALDVRIRDGVVYLAEGDGGLSLWRLEGAAVRPLGRYVTAGPVRGVVPFATGHALLHVGDANLEILDVRDPAHPRRVYACGSEGRGLLYGDQIAYDLIAGRYACVFWHVKPAALFDLSVDPPVPAGELLPHVRGWKGVVPDGDGALTTFGGGLVRQQVNRDGPVEVWRDPAASFEGRGRRYGDRLVVWQRAQGRIALVDIADPTRPHATETIELPCATGQPTPTGRGLVVPCGYDGLWVRDN